uniref:PAS domain-containing protein n=1 Tax=Horticoccus sp. 23ND18S-11 TaxID=3391832 RepID=UPI0039C9791B
MTFDDKATAGEILSELKGQRHIKWAVIFKDGTAFASYRNPGFVGTLPGRSPAEFGESFSSAGLLLHTAIELKGERVGTLQLAADTSQLGARLWEYGQILLVVFVAASLVAVFLAARLQRAIVTPVRHLAEAARLIGEGQNYSVRVEQRSKDELGRLTMAFNQMLARIQTQDAALRESRERFEIAVAGASDGIWDWNLLTNERYLSPQWKAMIGYAEDELDVSHEAWVELIHPDDRENAVRAVTEYLAGKRAVYEVEFRMRHKDGSHRWILSRGAALRDKSGKPYRMAGSHTDITERKQAEAQIHAAREKFESLVNSINGIVWEADAVEAHVLFMNGQAERILGYPLDRWLAEPNFWAKLCHPDDRMAAARANKRGIAIDITEQKVAAQQIERMQRELVDASRLAGMAEVATGVLHNVGNVLNSVNVSATLLVEPARKSKTGSLTRAVQLLQDHGPDLAAFLTSDPRGRQLPAFLAALADQLAREQALFVKESHGLQQNVEHIKQIVAMQQSYAKVSGATELIAMADLIEDALRISASALGRHRIELVREFESVPPVSVDRHKVMQILVNLVTNAKQALDARAEGRKIVLHLSRSAEERVRVEVIDNGAGIAAENLARIFNQGFTTKKSGHGFGLHSSANAAKEMGGSLHVRSAGPGTGATFILELPFGKADGPRPRAGAVEDALRSRRTEA